jgi:hypothetical protein
VCALKQDAFSFGFLQVLSGISPVVLGDPQGCPRQMPNEFFHRRFDLLEAWFL